MEHCLYCALSIHYNVLQSYYFVHYVVHPILCNVRCTSTMYIYIHCCAPQCFSPSELWPDLTCTLCTILCYAVHQDPSSKKYSISGSAQITLYCEFCALCSILSMGMQPSTALLLRSWSYRNVLCTLCTLYTVYTVYCTILSISLHPHTWGCNEILLSFSGAAQITLYCAACAHRVQFWGCNQVLLSF